MNDEETQRTRMRAYFRSLERSTDADPVADWLEAQREEVAEQQHRGPSQSDELARSGLAHADGRDHENPT